MNTHKHRLLIGTSLAALALSLAAPGVQAQ